MSVGIISFDHKSEAQEAHQLQQRFRWKCRVAKMLSVYQANNNNNNIFLHKVPYILLLALLNSAYTRLVT